MKVQTKPSTPRDQLSPEPIGSPPKKKPCTYQQIMVMEGGAKNMEAKITTQQDDELIKMESD